MLLFIALILFLLWIIGLTGFAAFGVLGYILLVVATALLIARTVREEIS